MGKIRDHYRLKPILDLNKSCKGDVQNVCSDKHIQALKECEQNIIKNCIVYQKRLRMIEQYTIPHFKKSDFF